MDDQSRAPVRGRVDVDETLPAVAIPGRILNELCAHALETLPEECCGLIVGNQLQPHRRVVRCRNEMTLRHKADPIDFPRDGRHAFYMSPADYQRADREAQAEGNRVMAVYHSHVGVGAYLSEMDLEYAESDFFPFPDADHIVLAVVERRVGKLGCFTREADGRFRGRPIVPAQP